MGARFESSCARLDSQGGCPYAIGLLFFNAQALGHFFVEEAFALAVGLDPFAVDHELRNGTLASALDHFVGGSRSAFDIDVLERDVMLLQEALGFAAVRAPEGGVDSYLHGQI